MHIIWFTVLFWMLLIQQPEYPYKKYQDRKEGILPKKQLVAGEKLVLISAAIENFERVPTGFITNEYKLGFYLKESARVKIEVQEFEHYYKMQPIQEAYLSGPNIFKWPSKIPLHYGIDLADLFPLAEIRGSGRSILVPIVLYNERPYNPEMSYRFSFEAYKTISVLEYTIVGSQEKLIFAGKLKDLKDKIIHVQWNGRDTNNRPVASGLLSLNVKATFKPPPGSVEYKTVTLNYPFYHFADLLRQKLLTNK